MEATLVLLTERYFNFTPTQNSQMFVFVGVLILLVQGGLVRRLAKKNIEGRMVSTGCLLVAIGLALTPTFHNIPMLCVSMAILALGSGINTPANQSILSKLANPERLGGVMGVGQSLSTLGRIIGPALGCFFFQHVGPPCPYWIGAVVMVVALIISLKLPAPAASREATPAETAAH
jgi:MFS family permease